MTQPEQWGKCLSSAAPGGCAVTYGSSSYLTNRSSGVVVPVVESQLELDLKVDLGSVVRGRSRRAWVWVSLAGR